MKELSCRTAAIASLSLVLVACNRDGDSNAQVSMAPAGLNNLQARVPAGKVVSGFKYGQLRTEFDVAGFSISMRPVTLEQFRACIQAGVCHESDSSCANLEGDGQDAALCVGLDNAQAYCSWSGGRLPRPSEWFLAARGRIPQRFSWGNRAPTCADHAMAPV